MLQNMLIDYDNEQIKKLFVDFELMAKKVGKERTKLIKKRYDQLKAAGTFDIYLSTGLGRPHPLYENLKGYYGVTITGNIRLIIKPDVDSLGPESLKECKKIIIKGVMDYHGRKNEWIIP